MAKTLLEVVNIGLRTIGEPVITAFTTNNILQDELIECANSAVHDLLERSRYRWGLFYDAFSTIAVVDAECVAATNGSTAVTSVTSAGAAADNFTSPLVAAGDWLRVGSDLTSYRVSTVDVSASPDALVLEDAYLGTTTTASSYKIIRDTFALSTSSLDEVVVFSCTADGIGRFQQKTLQEAYDLAGGDLHANTGGIPAYSIKVGTNSSGYPVYRLWPYPDDTYLIEYWYTLKFTSNTTAATNMFGANAPDIAYDAVADAVRERACIFDEDLEQGGIWNQKYEDKARQLAAREERSYLDSNQMDLYTYRTGYNARYGMRVESQILFDRAGFHHP